MKAVILAGGEGQRLRPLTKTRPKPLMRIGDRAILDIMIERLALHGIKETAITLGYKGEDIKNEIGEERYGVKIRYFDEKVPLGTAGSVKNCRGFIEGNTLILSGDALTNVDFSSLLSFHKEKGAHVTLTLAKRRNPSLYGVVTLGEGGKVSEFLEKPPLPKNAEALVNCGIYIIKKEVVERIPENTFYDFARDLFPKVNELYGFVTKDFWCDIGSFSEYRRSNLMTLSDSFFVHPIIEEKRKNATVTRSVIGQHSRIMKGARVCESVVGRHTRIGEHCILDGCILGDGVTVGEGVTIGRDTVVGDFAVLGDGAVLTSGQRIEPYSVFMG